MTDQELLRYVVEHRERHPDPAIRVALTENGVSPERIEKAMSEANRLERSAKETGVPIDLGEAEPDVSGVRQFMLSLVTLLVFAAIAAAIWFVFR